MLLGEWKKYLVCQEAATTGRLGGTYHGQLQHTTFSFDARLRTGPYPVCRSCFRWGPDGSGEDLVEGLGYLGQLIAICFFLKSFNRSLFDLNQRQITVERFPVWA